MEQEGDKQEYRSEASDDDEVGNSGKVEQDKRQGGSNKSLLWIDRESRTDGGNTML